jgi:hypothetical protein
MLLLLHAACPQTICAAGLRLPVPGLPRVDYTLIILPMPNQLQGRLWPYRLLMHAPGPAAIAISPGQYRPWPYSK